MWCWTIYFFFFFVWQQTHCCQLPASLAHSVPESVASEVFETWRGDGASELNPAPFCSIVYRSCLKFQKGEGEEGEGVWSPPALVPTLLAYIHFSSVFSWTIVSTLFTVLKTMFLASKIWTLILRNYAGPLHGTGSKVLWGYFCVSATVLKLVRVRAN